ncbi:MAG: hypothetical protein ACI4XB_09200 [Ruminococcus sp.]
MENYVDLIDHSHHVSGKHHAMPMRNRAAQFSPFAALTGFDAEIDETARLTNAKRELTEDEMDALNQTLRKLLDMAPEHPMVSVTYFQPDARKDGGIYVTYTGHFRFFDAAEGILKFVDRTEIPLDAVSHLKLILDRNYHSNQGMIIDYTSSKL